MDAFHNKRCVDVTLAQLLEKNDAKSKIADIHKLIQENSSNIDEISEILPSKNKYSTEKIEKDNEINEKQKILINLKTSLARLRENSEDLQSWEPIPIVGNKTSYLIAALSDKAIDESSIEVPLASILKVNNALNTLYDKCKEFGYINETQEMGEARDSLEKQFKSVANFVKKE